MKWALLIVIKLYWFVFPTNKRRTCLFKETCSHYVYRHTNEEGFYEGLKKLKMRLKQCKKGYQLYSGLRGFEMELADGSILKEVDISPKLLEPLYSKIKQLNF